MGDEIELAAVERLFGNAAGKLAMSSTKSAVGHLLGAAGAVEAIYSVLAIRDNVAPPTLNLDNPRSRPPIDLSAAQGAEAPDRHRALQLVRLRRRQRLPVLQPVSMAIRCGPARALGKAARREGPPLILFA